MVLFRQLSPLAGSIGILLCCISVVAFTLSFPTNILVFLSSLVFGISMIKIGFTRIIDEEEFYQLLEKIDDLKK